MMKASSYEESNDKSRADVLARNWGFVVLFLLLALGIATTLALVGGRALTHSQSVMERLTVQQQELRRLEKLIDDLPGGVAFVEVESGSIVQCNESFRVLTGMTTMELIGQPIRAIIPIIKRTNDERVLMKELRAAWDTYGKDTFTIQDAILELRNGKKMQCMIKIRGTRIDGRREWVFFIDPRQTIDVTDASK